MGPPFLTWSRDLPSNPGCSLVFSGCRARTPTTLGADTVEIMVGSDGWVRERAAMTEPYLPLPCVLLVDDDAGRVEYFENLLFRHGYSGRQIFPGSI